MRRHLLTAALVLASVAGTSAAQPSALTGFSFLRIEPSARAAAMGGAFSAVYGDDVNALFFNPALLNETMDGTLSLSYMNHVAGLNAGFVAYGRQVQRLGSVAAGLRFLSWGSLTRADENGQKMGTFGASDVALTVGAARTSTAYEQLRYGVNVHAVLSTVDGYHASALAFDGGVVYLLPAHHVTVSASVNNVGFTLSSLGDVQDRLPVDLRLGVAKKLQHVPLLLSITGYNLHDPGDDPIENASAIDDVLSHLALGAEFQFSEAFNVRLGYNHRRHETLKIKNRLDLAGVGVGFGIRITRIRFDYAYNSWSSLGGIHQFTVRTNI